MNNQEKLEQNSIEGLEMYFSPKIASEFAELEQNEKNFRVADIVDRVIVQEIEKMPAPLYTAELGGGAHPDRYHKFFEKLLEEPRGHIDWVDVSPYMLELAKKYIDNEKYKEREEVIDFVRSEIMEYLSGLEDEKLDVALMKYTFDYIEDIKTLFQLLSEKLKINGELIASLGSSTPELKSHSTNARFLHNGEEFPDGETRTLKDGDTITIKIFKVSGDPTSGYLEGADIKKHYHSAEKIKELAETFGFDVFLGDWKDFVKEEKQEGEEMDQAVLVLTKK